MENFICCGSSSASASLGEDTTTRKRRWSYLIAGGTILVLIFVAVVVTFFEVGVENDQFSCSNVTKSPTDLRHYCAFQLPNQMRVILISDPGTDKSAAALVVGAGFLSDPPQVPGMAHYLEHYLFMGTEKFPVDNQLSQFLAKNGGHSNAFTNDALTGYHFDTSPHSFEEAIERFSQFFTAPLLSPTKLKGVMSAVDSEFQNARLNDYRRSFQVIRAMTNSTHPYSRHHIGNALTLWTLPMERSIDVRSIMVKFFRDHYSANLMSLVVLGRESLDDLKVMAKKYFGPIPNTNVPKPGWPVSPWGEEQLGRRIDIVRLVEFTRMDVIFPIPDYTDQYKSKATDYVSSLLGQEEPGSILSLLKTKKKWATALSTFVDVPGRGFALIGINIQLTVEGSRHVEDVVFHIFQFLELMKKIGPQKWYWDTLAQISATRFRFMDDSAAVGIVRHLARNMQTYPATEAWSAHYNYTDYQPHLITSLVNILNPSNMVLVTTSKENSKFATHKEPTYGVDYSYHKIDPGTIQRWANCGLSEDLKFPSPNEFLPNSFDLKPRNKVANESSRIVPRIILDDDMSRVWFLQDEEFLVPRASVNLHIFNPFTSQSARNRNLQNLLVHFVHAMVKESSYAALEAGLDYEIVSKSHGIFVNVKGYDDKIPRLLDHLLQFLVNSTTLLKENGDRFDIVKEIYLKRFDNFKFEKPGVKARDNLVHLMSRQVYSRHELLAAAKDLTVQDVIEFATKIFAQLKLEWLIHGNLVENDALALNKMGMKHLKKLATRPMHPSQLSGVIHQGVKLPEASSYLYQAEEETSSESCVLSYLQSSENGAENLREERILMMFMDKMLNVPCFNVLRTQENLGYSVACFAFQDDGFWGFQIFVQGENHPDFVQTRIHNFLQSMVPTMNNLTSEEFLKYKTAVRTSITARKPKNLNDRTRFLNWQMEAGTYDFERVDEDLKKLEEISLEQVTQFFNTWISPAAPRRKVLSVHMISKNVTNKAAPDGWNYKEMVGEIGEWKGRLGFNPVHPPYTKIPAWPSPQ